MIVEFDKSFEKSLAKIKDTTILSRIERIIIKAENSNLINYIPNTKKLIGFSDYFRIKIGDYRLGFERIDNETIRFIIISHRKDIYRRFP
jgi:mRNA interferase RelE/StbE